MADIESNKELIRRFLEVFSTGNVKQIVDFLDEQATWWISGSLPISGTHTKAEVEKLFYGMHELVNGPIKLTPKAFTAEGNRVAVELESLAHTKTGRTYNNLYHFLFEIRNGKLLRIREYMDPMHVHAVFFEP